MAMLGVHSMYAIERFSACVLACVRGWVGGWVGGCVCVCMCGGGGWVCTSVHRLVHMQACMHPCRQEDRQASRHNLI